ncbi:membrane protein [Microbacterium phage Jenos]|nr:membrane protein [Microbacterium phage Jenos]
MSDPWGFGQWAFTLLGHVLVWVLILLAIVGALILVFAILVGFWRAIRGILPQTSGLRRTQVTNEASGVAESLYGSQFSGHGMAFMAGVDYVIRAIERKPYAGRRRKRDQPTKLI